MTDLPKPLPAEGNHTSRQWEELKAIPQGIDEVPELAKAKSNANYWMKRCEVLQTQLDMLTAPETTKYALRAYAQLDADGRQKIDALMDALLAIKRQA